MELVYEFFFNFLDSPEFNLNIARNYLDNTFVVEVIQNQLYIDMYV